MEDKSFDLRLVSGDRGRGSIPMLIDLKNLPRGDDKIINLA